MVFLWLGPHFLDGHVRPLPPRCPGTDPAFTDSTDAETQIKGGKGWMDKPRTLILSVLGVQWIYSISFFLSLSLYIYIYILCIEKI